MPDESGPNPKINLEGNIFVIALRGRMGKKSMSLEDAEREFTEEIERSKEYDPDGYTKHLELLKVAVEYLKSTKE